MPFEPRQPWLPDAAQRLVGELAPDEADDIKSAAATTLADRLRCILLHQLRDPCWIGRMIALAQEAQPLYPEPALLEQQLYSGGFIGRQDDALRARMLRMTPSDFVRHIPAIFDERLASTPGAVPLSKRATCCQVTSASVSKAGVSIACTAPTTTCMADAGRRACRSGAHPDASAR